MGPNDGEGRWHEALPHPVAFVLSGGASLGAVQVGMLAALREAGLSPDLVTGTSAGALNAAAIAAYGMADGTTLLEELWQQIERRHLFPGNRLRQMRQLLASRLSLFPNDSLDALVRSLLPVTTFEALRMPLGVTVTDLLTHQGRLVTTGEIAPALLASAALPGLYPPVVLDGRLYVDGGLVANVPMEAALEMGAASMVVLDAADTCRPEPPRHIAELLLLSLHTMMSQQARRVPRIAARVPVLYLCRPCPITRSPFDFTGSAALMAQATASSRTFLQGCALPSTGAMSGGPHLHHEPRAAGAAAGAAHPGRAVHPISPTPLL